MTINKGVSYIKAAKIMPLIPMIVALLLLHSPTLTNAGPGEVIFGQSASFSGGAWEPAPRFNAGLNSAFEEVNKVGGVNGRRIVLHSLDDQYDVNKIAPNVASLLAIPDMFSFVAFMGSPTTAKALPLAAAAQMPIIGPLTGSAVFRKTFNPWTINVRAGYDDEAMAMLRLFITEKQYRRVSLIYQDDAFGAPAKDAILLAMENMKLEMASIHAYDKPKIPEYDFAAYAQDVWKHRPQGIILFCVEGFSNAFMREFFKIQTYPVSMVTGSWIGDGNRNYLRANKMDPTEFYMTQVVPHPLSELNITKRYRAAMMELHGAASAEYDYLSLEGYIVGRMVIEALRRTPEASGGGGGLDRAEFLKAIYSTKMFGFEELLAGPFSDDCTYDPGTAKGRSSMCFCNQGMRVVATTVQTASYEYKTAAGDMVYPMTECFATKDIVQRPILLSNVRPDNSDAVMETAARQIGVGVELNPGFNSLSKDLLISDSTSNATTDALTGLGENHPLLGVIGGMPMAAQQRYPIFPVYGAVPFHDRAFRRETIHLFATIQQQIYVASSHLSTAAAAKPVHVLLSEEVAALVNDEGATIRQAFEHSFESHDVADVTFATFSSTTDLTAKLGTVPPTASLFAYGLRSAAAFSAMLDVLETNSNMNAFITFDEMSLHNAALEARYAVEGVNASSNSVPSRIHFATNLPLWTGSGELAKKYQEIMAGAGLQQNVSNPLYFTGYFISRVVEFVLVRSQDASPSAFMSELYRTSVVAMDGVALGPYIEEQCSNEDCLCNVGARVVAVHSVGSMCRAEESSMSVRFSKCHVQYQLKVPAGNSYTAAIASGTILPVLFLIGGILAMRSLARYRKLMHAPKDPSKKLHAMFIQLKRETLLWERSEESMGRIMEEYVAMVNHFAKEHQCYIANQIGGAILLTAVSAEQIMGCASQANRELSKKDWEMLMNTSEYTQEHHPMVMSLAGKSRKSKSDAGSKRSRQSARNEETVSNCSRSTAGSRMGIDNVQVEFCIGVHYDRAHVRYDEERHKYHYSGPAVDGAAIAADKAHGEQILITNKVDRTVFDESCFVEFCTSEWGKDTVLLQFNPPGVAMKFFAVDEQDETYVDSITAQLEQQSAGVTNKRVTVASIYFHALEERANSLPRESFARLYAEKMSEVQEIVKADKGHIHALVGPRITISFNAVSPTPQATMRAFSAIEAIRTMEAREHGRITSGIAAEASIVGAFDFGSWHHDALVSKVAETASLLQRMCQDYAESHCLAQHTMFEELNCFAIVEYVDFIRLPDSAKPRLLISVHEFKEEQENDEWMYELQNAASGSAYAHLNNFFDKLTMWTSLPPNIDDQLEAVCDDAKLFCGFQNLVSLIELHRQQHESENKTVRETVELYVAGKSAVL